MRHKTKPTESVYKDPVCGMEISYKVAPATSKFDGKIYCFCSDLCREAFEKEPEKYVPCFNKP